MRAESCWIRGRKLLGRSTVRVTMAYPPPNPGGPGYPPPPTAGYPPQDNQYAQTAPWGSVAPQPGIPTPGGSIIDPVLGFGPPSTSEYSPSTYPPAPAAYPPHLPSQYPPNPPPSQPIPYGGSYLTQQPPPGGYHPQQPPPGGYPPQQPPPGGYPPQQPPPGAYPPQQPPPGAYPPQQPPPGAYPPQQPPPGAYPPQQPPPGAYPPQQPPPGVQPPLGGYLSQHPPPGDFLPQQPPMNKMQRLPGGGYPVNQPPPSDHQPAGGPTTQSDNSKRAPSPTTSSRSQKVVTRGTVKDHTPFDAEEDARRLRKAMKGFGTDEKAIINVVAYRSNSQRQQIKLKFKTMYGKDLISDFKSELSGHFEEVVLGLMMTPAEYDASAVYKAIKGLGTDENTLIEILCTRSNAEIQDLKKQYKNDQGRDIERDVASDTSGHFKRFLISMLTGSRERDGSVDHERARTDAQSLYQAGEAKWGTDESKFNEVLASRSFDHLRVVFHEYSKICKYDIEQSIEREMSGDLKKSMLTIVKCVRDKASYFAEGLYKSMKGLGTDDRTLVRVMVTRCEVDMEDIKDKFYKNYRKYLGSFIKDDTSGDYRRILMALARADQDY